MFPSQTSLIPATVALAKFLEANGAGGVYPFWYLGTTPFKYLTGPVVPYLLVFVKKILPVFSYFDLSIFLVFISFFISAFGWGLLAWFLSKDRRLGIVVGILSLIMPWHIVSALGLSEVSAVLANSLTPWILLAFQRFTIHDLRFKNLLPPAIIFALLLLTNSTASVSVIVGVLILAFVSSKHWQEGLKKAAIVFAGGWFLSLWWYGFGFWLTVWGAPGIGGKNILGVLGTLLNFLRGFLPVIAAVLIVSWKVKPKTVFDKFSLGWIVIFGSLTLFRFMADWDFWMDWTVWTSEVEVGVALVFAKLIYDSRFKIQDFNTFLLFVNPKSLFVILLIVSGWFLAWQNRGFWLPRVDMSGTVEYKIAHLLEQETRNKKQETGKNSTVFLSGTTAFWLNALVDVKQVRGGRDEASVNNKWRDVSWEVREGDEGNRAVEALRGLGVDYLVVHADQSKEFYHDFKYPEKFEGVGLLEKIYDQEGDVIYQIK